MAVSKPLSVSGRWSWCGATWTSRLRGASDGPSTHRSITGATSSFFGPLVEGGSLRLGWQSGGGSESLLTPEVPEVNQVGHIFVFRSLVNGATSSAFGLSVEGGAFGWLAIECRAPALRQRARFLAIC